MRRSKGFSNDNPESPKNVNASLSVQSRRFGFESDWRIKSLLSIKHLEPHRVYYLPKSKVVVAVEVMEG